MSLVFNGVETNKVMWNGIETKGILNGSVLWGKEQIFRITVNQPTGGTITATPIEGKNGTIVTLSNTPSTDYKFVSYSVTGATLNNNQFTINGSDVNVTGTFSRYKQVFVNLGSTEYSNNTSTTKYYTLTGMPSSTDFKYLTFVLNGYLKWYMAADIYFVDNSNGLYWRCRWHTNTKANVGFVGITGKVTGWTTQSGQTVSTGTLNNISYRFSSKWQAGGYPKIKIVFDRTNKRGYFYIDGTLIGYATMNADMINVKKIGLLAETGSSDLAKVKNIRVAGFSTLADAQAYNG